MSRYSILQKELYEWSFYMDLQHNFNLITICMIFFGLTVLITHIDDCYFLTINFSYIVTVSFIGGGNQSNRENQRPVASH